MKSLKNIIIGNPIKSEDIHGERFNLLTGFPILSSDAISSVAYATEEILLIMIPVIGIAAFSNLIWVSLAIIALLFILITSYTQTIKSYPNGGGSFIVSKDNLGDIPALVAASSLIIGYTLTVAVSISSGVAAITSMIPQLLSFKVELGIILVLLLMVGNLRGLKDAAKLFSIPTYAFIAIMLIMIGTGFVKVAFLGYKPDVIVDIPTQKNPMSTLTLALFIRAFASGCTALTGVEAVSDSVPNFEPPSQRNAIKVLVMLGLVVFIIFAGISYLATNFKAVPNDEVTVIAQIATQVFGRGSFMFIAFQIVTALILVMAANTAFADFPLMLSVLAREGFAPRQFAKRGDRLNFSNGIIALAVAAMILILIFKGSTHALLPLYAVGVFISFTLSQYAMFTRWRKLKSENWKIKALINGFGAFVTACISLIVGYLKFSQGAWIVLILIPFISFILYNIKQHYNEVRENIIIKGNEPILKYEYTSKVILPVEAFNKSFIKSLNYSKSISDDITLVHISIDKEKTEKLIKMLKDNDIKFPLEIRKYEYRDIVKPMFKFIKENVEHLNKGEMITVVLPSFEVRKFWHNFLHNQTTVFMRIQLLRSRHVAVVTVPYHILKNY